MKKEDLFEAVGLISDEYIEESGRRPAKRKFPVKWAAAVCACGAVIAAVLLLRGLGGAERPEAAAKPVYNPAKTEKTVNLSPRRSGARVQSESTYDENGTYVCRDKNETDYLEERPVIEEPFFYDLRYDGGGFYVCVVEGYDPSYSKSECGGWHFDDAVVKKWYFVDMESGKLADTPEKAEPRGSAVYIYGTGIFKNVSWSGKDMEVKNGYFCRNSGGAMELCFADESGKTEVLYKSSKLGWGSVETVGEGYVAFTASRDGDGAATVQNIYVFSREKGEIVMEKRQLFGDGLTYRPHFIMDGKLYCDKFTDYNGNFDLVSFDIETGEEKTVQEDVPFRNCLNMYIDGGIAACDVSEGYRTEGRGGIYVFSGEGFERIKGSENAENCAVGTILDGKVYFTALFGEENGLFCYDTESGETEKTLSFAAKGRIIYAGQFYCIMTKTEVICGRL